MRITFDHLQKQPEKEAVRHTNTAARIERSVRRAVNGGVMADPFGADNMKNGMQYGRGKTMQDVGDEVSLIDGAAYKNYMAVMSHTMSGEDFKELTKDGVHPGKVDVKDAVTIMDHIKANMAESGVVIDGFNGEGDMSLEKLTQITGDAGYAQSIVAAFQENDVPLTEENVSRAMEAVDQAQQITELTDDVKQYLLENDLPATIDTIYKAVYSVSGHMQQSGGGYFADDTSGYYGKKPQQVDTAALEEQIEKVILQADLEVTQETKQQAFWMIEKGILLTPEHMRDLQELNSVSFPPQTEDILQQIAGALREGKDALQADLTKEDIYTQAETLYTQVQELSDEDLYAAIQSGKTIHIQNLSRVHRDIRLWGQIYDGRRADAPDVSSMEPKLQDQMLHERRMLEEVRLKMTVSANILLLKSDYAIDTAPLSELVEALKEAENSRRDYGLSLPQQEQTELYRETMEKRADLMEMPAAATAKIMGAQDAFTLRRLHEEGSILKSAYDKAGESYEALMTKPRADLGDRISSAFSNIDDLLAENEMEPNDENRRAVRILAYNQMEITKENIEKVAQADEMVTRLLNQMTPAATLNMIRDGVNPLEQSIPELTEYFEAQEGQLTEQAERFSRFLYKLEQEKSISQEERDSYIGIYRLIRQVEKGDRRAIGRLVDDGRELSFANLLSAVRTGHKKPIDLRVDDSFGALQQLQEKGVSISEQISSYFALQEDPALEDAYTLERYQTFREDVSAGTEYVELLMESGQQVTVDNLSAMRELTQNRGSLYRDIRRRLERTQNVSDAAPAAGESEKTTALQLPSFDELAGRVRGQFTSAENAVRAVADLSEQVSGFLQETMFTQGSSYLDIRALTSLSKQLSLVDSMAQQQVFELPAVIDGELTSVQVRFEDRSVQEQAGAKVTIRLTDGRQIMASFAQEKDQIKGYVGCNDADTKEKIEQGLEKFYESILSETGKTADIAIVQSDTLEETEKQKNKSAGKQTLIYEQNRAEQDQGREQAAGALYQTVKSFMELFE